MPVSTFPNRGGAGSRLDMKPAQGRAPIFVGPPPSVATTNLRGGWAARSVTPGKPLDLGEQTNSPLLLLNGQGALGTNASAAPKWQNQLDNFSQDGIFGPFISDRMLKFPGVIGNYVSIPDAAALDITDNLDIRVLISADGWQSSELATTQGIVSKGAAYQFNLRTQAAQGTLQFIKNGTEFADATVKVPFADGEPGWVRVTFAAGVVTFYWAPLEKNSPSRQGEPNTWTQLGATVALAGTINVGTDPLLIGSRLTTEGPFAGWVYKVFVYNAIITDINSAAATTARVIELLKATTTPFSFTAGLASWTESQQGQGTVTHTVFRAGAGAQTLTFSRSQFDATFSQLGPLRWQTYLTTPAKVNMNPGPNWESFVAFIHLDLNTLPAFRGRYPLIAQKPAQNDKPGWGIWWDSGLNKFVFPGYNDVENDGTSTAIGNNIQVATPSADMVILLTVHSTGSNQATIRVHTVDAAGVIASSVNLTYTSMNDLFGDGTNAPLVSVLDPNLGGIYAAGMLRLPYRQATTEVLTEINKLVRGTSPVYAVGDWWAIGSGIDTSVIGPVTPGDAVVVTAVDGTGLVPTLATVASNGQKTWVAAAPFTSQGAGLTPVNNGVDPTLLASAADDLFIWGVQQFNKLSGAVLGYKSLVQGYSDAGTYLEMSFAMSGGNVNIYAELDTEDGQYASLFEPIVEANFYAEFEDKPFFWAFRFNRSTQTLTADIGSYRFSVVASPSLLGLVTVSPEDFGFLADFNGWAATMAWGGGIDTKAPSDAELLSFKTQVLARYGLAS